MSNISQKEFETFNWLPIKERYNQCVNSVAFKYFDNQCPHYLNEVFMKASESSSSLRNSYQKLSNLSVKLTQVKMYYLSYEEIKRPTNLNAFKHNLKKHYLKERDKANF